MPRVRVWRCVGEQDLQLLTECTTLAASFLVNDVDVLVEFIKGEFAGHLLNRRQFEIALEP